MTTTAAQLVSKLQQEFSGISISTADSTERKTWIDIRALGEMFVVESFGEAEIGVSKLGDNEPFGFTGHDKIMSSYAEVHEYLQKQVRSLRT